MNSGESGPTHSPYTCSEERAPQKLSTCLGGQGDLGGQGLLPARCPQQQGPAGSLHLGTEQSGW